MLKQCIIFVVKTMHPPQQTSSGFMDAPGSHTKIFSSTRYNSKSAQS